MPKLPRRTDADYIRFPPYYVFKSVPHHDSISNLWRPVWSVIAVLAVAGLIAVVGFLILRAVFAAA
jgi:hypothetical protein